MVGGGAGTGVRGAGDGGGGVVAMVSYFNAQKRWTRHSSVPGSSGTLNRDHATASARLWRSAGAGSPVVQWTERAPLGLAVGSIPVEGTNRPPPHLDAPPGRPDCFPTGSALRVSAVHWPTQHSVLLAELPEPHRHDPDPDVRHKAGREAQPRILKISGRCRSLLH